jgi:tetratricopeptide (TPR) repeat protein
MWDLQSKILYKLGRRQEALETAKEGLRHSPGAITLLFNVADVALALNDLDTAQKHLEIAEKAEPGQAHETLARVWLLRGNAEKAEQEAKLALQTHQIPTKALMILGSIEMDKKNYAKALDYYQRAAGESKRWTGKPIENLHANSGDALARLGRNEEAEREFRAEIVDFPKNARAYSSLIVLLVTQRRSDEATRLVFDAIKASPTPDMYMVISETLKAIGDDRGAMFWAYQGIQKFPQNAELRRLPNRLEAVTPMLQEHMRTN